MSFVPFERCRPHHASTSIRISLALAVLLPMRLAYLRLLLRLPCGMTYCGLHGCSPSEQWMHTFAMHMSPSSSLRFGRKASRLVLMLPHSFDLLGCPSEVCCLHVRIGRTGDGECQFVRSWSATTLCH